MDELEHSKHDPTRAKLQIFDEHGILVAVKYFLRSGKVQMMGSVEALKLFEADHPR